LMFLLLLMGLGAASVKAQVRIGGNTAPSAAAVLDLNAGNDSVANTGTRGLVLPRVDLTSSTKQLTNGVANQTGTMVYNVTTTLGRIGVYYWNGNNWVLASLPSTSAGDSGKLLMSNGSTYVLTPQGYAPTGVALSSLATISPVSVTWTKVIDGSVYVTMHGNSYAQILASGITGGEYCVGSSGFQFTTASGAIYIFFTSQATLTNYKTSIKCYRPSA